MLESRTKQAQNRSKSLPFSWPVHRYSDSTYLTRPLSTLFLCITASIKQNIHHGCCTQFPPECTFIVASQVTFRKALEAVTISSTATKCFEIRGYLHRLATWASLGFRSAISAFSPSSVLKSVSVSVSVSSSRPSGSSTMARPRGFGARHINDHAPFSLWNEEKQDFRQATAQEAGSIMETYTAKRLEFHDYLMVIETSNPPKPVPLTVACIPAIFVPPGQGRKYMMGLAPYVGPRVRDPCPHLSWGRMRTPTVTPSFSSRPCFQAFHLAEAMFSFIPFTLTATSPLLLVSLLDISTVQSRP